MIHLNGCLSLQCAKINFMSRVSLHVRCKMRGTQEEVAANASQMIFNFSDVFKCRTFAVRLMREAECSVSIKYVSLRNAFESRQVLPPSAGNSFCIARLLCRGSLLHRAGRRAVA